MFSCQNNLKTDKLFLDAKRLDSIGNYYESIKIYDKIINLDNKYLKAYLNRGVDKSILGDWKGAIYDMTQVINLDSDNTLGYYNRAIFYGNINEFQKAILDFKLAIESKGGELIWMDKEENPNIENGFEYDVKMEEIRLERGITYFYLDSLNNAYKDLSFAISKSFNLKDSYYYRGLVLLKANKKGACLDLEQSIKFDNKKAKDVMNKYCK